MKYLYLAHPITKGNPFHNVHEACKQADILMKRGFIVMVPGLSALYDMIIPTHYEVYMTQDFAWIERCDCIIRLPGESSGADREIEHAKSLGKQVFYGVQAFLDYIDQFAETDIKKLTAKPITQEAIFAKED